MQFFREEFGTLFTVQMDGRHDHMGRTLSGNGKHPFAEVCFPDMQAFFFQVAVEVDFLRGHGF